MGENKGIHDGHRDRVRDRFLSEGLEGFRDHQVMELLLFYGIPRKDTNEVAHKLIDRFDSFSGVFDATYDSLVECGLSKTCASFIKLIPAVCSRYYVDKYKSKNKTTQINSDNIGECVLPYFIGKDEEQVLLILLDPKGNRLFCDIISSGAFSAAELNFRKIMQLCVKYKAYGAVLAHNHPSGLALPSEQDIRVTKKLKSSLASIDVRLMDHLIVADLDYCPMSELENCEDIFY